MTTKIIVIIILENLTVLENYWDNYWDQPTEYNLDEVYKSSNVILSSANISKLLEKNYGYYDLNSKKFLETKDR